MEGNLINYYTGVLKNYVGFEGRARRAEYWQFTLVNFVISLVAELIGAAVKFPLLDTIYGLAVFLPGLAVSVRRLHDTGRSGWWNLIVFTCIGIIVLIVFLCQDSKPGPNKYGENPKGIGNQPVDQYGNPYNAGY
jgi:uncharacterized membrane protein YhaH (DUF805 family)